MGRYEQFRYTQLSSRRKIRLLKAQWTPRQRTIYQLTEHELENTDISHLDVSGSPYVAVSYCWGLTQMDVPLLIMQEGQEKVLPVTAGAWEAIERTAPAISIGGKSLWIDQICINQTNDREKERQVELMGEIYRRCWHCMIWLGPADAHTATAFGLLNNLHQNIDQYRSLDLIERHVSDLSHAQIRAMLTKSEGCDLLPPVTDPGWVAVARLLERPWFTRLWTFQEAVLSYEGDASFRCGHYNIPFKTFHRASMFLGDQWNQDGIGFAGIRFASGRARLREIGTFRGQVKQKKPTPLLWLLGNNVSTDCYDQRDRIFAFLGMRNEDGPVFPVDVDYKRSPKDLYTEVTRKIIRSQQSLRVCADAAERAQEGGLVGLPSWVPDWTRIPIANAFESLNIGAPHFHASSGRNHVGVDNDPRILSVQGEVVDEIVVLIDVEVPNDSSEAKRSDVLTQQVIPILLATLRSCTGPMTDAQIAHKIVNTITLGGFTRYMQQGDFGLPHDAWLEVTCCYMISALVLGVQYAQMPVSRIDPAQWLHALTRQALQCANRRFALLKNNLLGLLPRFSNAGDLIVILHGSSLPFVLRPAEKGCFKLVGVCFVDGIMHGEKVDWVVGRKFDIC